MSPYTLWHTDCLYVRALHRTSKPKTKRRCLGPKLNATLDTAAAVQCAYCYLKYTRSNLMVRTAGTASRKHRLAAAIPPKGKTWQSANTDQQQLLQLHMTHDPNKMPVRNATCMHNANSMRRTQSTCSAQGTALQTVDNATSAHCRIPQVARVHCTMPQPCTSTLPSACTSCTISHTMPQALHETMPPAAGACTLWDAPQYACHKPGQQIMLISSTPCMHCMLPQAFTSMQCPMQCTAYAARTLHTAEGMF